jgi:hypothetical protein
MSAKPILSKQYKTFPWTKHIHRLLKELCPHLLEQEPVINAFNALINCLTTHRNVFQTFKTSVSYTYEVGINVTYIDVTYSTGKIYTLKRLKGFPHRFHGVSQEQEQEISSDIYQHYMVLYEWIKRDIVPAMERKAHAINMEKNIKYTCKRIAQYDEQIKKVKQRCENDIQVIQNHIFHLSMRMKEFEMPCVVTKFPPK